MVPYKFNQLGIDEDLSSSSSSSHFISADVSFFVSDFEDTTIYLHPTLMKIKYYGENELHDIPFSYNSSTKKTTINISSENLFTIATSADGYLSAIKNSYYTDLRNISLVKITPDPPPENPDENKAQSECEWTAGKDNDSHILVYARARVSAEQELSVCNPDYHVYYRQKQYKVGNNIVAQLDADITSIPSGGVATETLRIFDLSSYDYVISFIKYSGDVPMLSTNQTVTINLEGVPYGPYRIADANIENASGDWWHLFEIRNKEIKEINLVTNSAKYQGLTKS